MTRTKTGPQRERAQRQSSPGPAGNADEKEPGASA